MNINTKEKLDPKTKVLRPIVLVTGANGQLGNKICQLLTANYKLILTDYDNMDITDPVQIENVMQSEKPEFIIHGAAYTKVDAAEDNEALCRKINALGTKNVAEAAKKHDSTLIYISTDYVFDGMGGCRTQDLGLRIKDSGEIPKTQDLKPKPYYESDTPNPQSVYGRTKFEGEQFIQNICEKYYILRISWLFGELPENAPGTNFIETMIRLSKEKEELTIVSDQIGSPTYTKDLVILMDQIIRTQDLGSRTCDEKTLRPKTHNLNPAPYGLYHFSGDGACSWYDFAKEIFKLTGSSIKVTPVTSDQFIQKAKRPAYSYMSKDKIKKALNIKVRSWQEMVTEYLISEK